MMIEQGGEEEALVRSRARCTTTRALVAGLFACSSLLISSMTATRGYTEFAREDIGLVVENAYTQALGPIGLEYPGTSASRQLIDAHKPFSVIVVASPERTAAARTLHLLRVDTHEDTVVSCAGGRCEVGVMKPADYALSVDLGDAIAEIELAVRHVRREVRELSDEDRENWLDALDAVFRTEGDVGRRIYGGGFRSAPELSALHGVNSARRDADHVHRGLGFTAQHVRLDKLLGHALRAVNARVCAPYWDWTIDETQLRTGAIASVYDSPIFSAEMFGSPNFVDDPVVWPSPSNALIGASMREVQARGLDAFAIRDSRFRFLTIGSPIRGTYPVNAYGVMRSPWNMNPSRLVTRFHVRQPMWIDGSGASLYNPTHYPTCGALYDAFVDVKNGDTSATNLTMTFETRSLHARLHWIIAGVTFDDDAMQSALASLPPGHNCPDPFTAKYIWRAQLADVQPDCNATGRLGDCGLLPLQDDAAIGRFVVTQASCIKNDASIPANVTTAQYAVIGQLWRSAIITFGDALDASSPSDPAFHLIHPTLARYFQFSYLINPGLKDDWPNFDHGDACTASQCIGLNGTPAPVEVCCAGHYRYSTMYDPLNSGNVAAPGSDLDVSNERILQTLLPTEPSTDGMFFHHFRWAHCSEHDFGALLL